MQIEKEVKVTLCRDDMKLYVSNPKTLSENFEN